MVYKIVNLSAWFMYMNYKHVQGQSAVCLDAWTVVSQSPYTEITDMYGMKLFS